MNADRFLRQHRLLPPERIEGKHLCVVGAGALGSSILLCVCKLGWGAGCRVSVSDPDRCEPHNLGTQWFLDRHVEARAFKVDAVAEVVSLVCGRQILPFCERFTGAEAREIGPILVLAVDSLEERLAIWRRVRDRRDVALLVDARMGGDVADIQALVLGADATSDYEGSLEPPEGPFEAPCGAQSIADLTLGAASLVGAVIRAWATERPFPRRLVVDYRGFALRSEPTPAPGAAAPASRRRRRRARRADADAI